MDLDEWEDLASKLDSLTPAEEARLDQIMDEFLSTDEGQALSEALAALADLPPIEE